MEVFDTGTKHLPGDLRLTFIQDLADLDSCLYGVGSKDADFVRVVIFKSSDCQCQASKSLTNQTPVDRVQSSIFGRSKCNSSDGSSYETEG